MYVSFIDLLQPNDAQHFSFCLSSYFRRKIRNFFALLKTLYTIFLPFSVKVALRVNDAALLVAEKRWACPFGGSGLVYTLNRSFIICVVAVVL